MREPGQDLALGIRSQFFESSSNAQGSKIPATSDNITKQQIYRNVQKVQRGLTQECACIWSSTRSKIQTLPKRDTDGAHIGWFCGFHHQEVGDSIINIGAVENTLHVVATLIWRKGTENKGK